MAEVFTIERPTDALRALNYTPAVEALRRRSGLSLGTLLLSMGPAYGSVFVRLDCEPEHGVELITQGDMFAAEPQGRIIRRDSMPQAERHEVHKWQVLIAGAGTLGQTELYGRSLIADARLVGKYVGPHAMVLTFNEPGSDLSLFAYAFLCTAIGVRALRAASYGTKILGLRKDLLSALPIPDVDQDTMRRVADLVRVCVEQRERYLDELRAARKVIEDLPEMRDAYAMCAERQARSVSWPGPFPTLLAWTFASTGNALEFLRKRWSRRLRDVIIPSGVFNGPRFARISCDRPHGVEFMSQRDAFLIRPIPRQIVHPGFSDNQLFAKPGTIMVGGHGTLGEGEIFGRAVRIHGRLASAAFTQDLLRVIPRDGLDEQVYAFLTTLVGFRLLRSTAVGTKILSMRLDLLEDLPFPDLSADTCSAVRCHVQKASVARDTAEAAETEAVRIVEEEVLPAWLE